jgi:hypothetical protein
MSYSLLENMVLEVVEKVNIPSKKEFNFFSTAQKLLL